MLHGNVINEEDSLEGIQGVRSRRNSFKVTKAPTKLSSWQWLPFEDSIGQKVEEKDQTDEERGRQEVEKEVLVETEPRTWQDRPVCRARNV